MAVQNGLPNCVPPRKPLCPGSPLTTRPGPDFLSTHFHAPELRKSRPLNVGLPHSRRKQKRRA